MAIIGFLVLVCIGLFFFLNWAYHNSPFTVNMK